MTAPAPSRSAWRGTCVCATPPAARPTRSRWRAAVELANFYCDDGRWDEAADCLAYAKDVPEPSLLPAPRACCASSSRRASPRTAAELAEALTLAQRAVDARRSRRRTSTSRPRVQVALAEVQRRGGRTAEADAAVATAIGLYEKRGNVTAADRLRPAGTTSRA